MLNTLKADHGANNETEYSLMCAIFAKPPGSDNMLEIKNDTRRTQVLAMVRHIMIRHAAIDYNRLLKMCVDRSVIGLSHTRRLLPADV